MIHHPSLSPCISSYKQGGSNKTGTPKGKRKELAWNDCGSSDRADSVYERARAELGAKKGEPLGVALSGPANLVAMEAP